MRLRDCKFQISYGPSDDRLNGFYIPALSSSVRYDRSAGFFTSTALAVAAAGVARLVANGGTMRLLVGAEQAHRAHAASCGHQASQPRPKPWSKRSPPSKRIPFLILF